jgi:hypothetical protein
MDKNGLDVILNMLANGIDTSIQIAEKTNSYLDTGRQRTFIPGGISEYRPKREKT